ncbi:MAG: HAD-IIB family hydrolase [Clostridia bacterium]|nr:HAD-IIB family hydrolase [Clostridia bacterium]
MKRFENIILASDIDGTFLTSVQEGKQRNRAAIEYFKEQGGHFTFATGRNYRQILAAIPEAPELTNLPAVTCNGASLYDFQKQEEVLRYLMNVETVRELINWLAEQDPTVGVRGATEQNFLFTSLENPFIQRDFEALRSQQARVVPIEQWKDYSLYKLAVRANEDTLERLRPRMEEQFRGRLEITQSDPTLVDVQADGRTKAALLRELTQRSEISSPYLCVAGDYDNDLAMLRVADLACCPSNAQPCVKAICHRTVCHYREGAIADIIEYLDRCFKKGEEYDR